MKLTPNEKRMLKVMKGALLELDNVEGCMNAMAVKMSAFSQNVNLSFLALARARAVSMYKLDREIVRMESK